LIWAVAVAFGLCAAAGVYLALSRDLLRCVLGLSILSSAVNLLVFASGRLGSAAPPLVPADATLLPPSANPLPQALVLTAIVIGFALTCFSLVLAVRLAQRTDGDDTRALRFAEPVPDDPLAPPVEADERDEPDGGAR
jgi:multicomponent Na+:H+ antiporter subunit C